MMRIFPESQGNVLGVLLSNKITRRDYREVLMPTLDRVISHHGKVRVLIDFADDFAGFEWRIIVDDLRYVLSHLKQFERVAVINCPLVLRPFFAGFEFLTKCRVRYFLRSAHEQAWSFIEGTD